MSSSVRRYAAYTGAVAAWLAAVFAACQLIGFVAAVPYRADLAADHECLRDLPSPLESFGAGLTALVIAMLLGGAVLVLQPGRRRARFRRAVAVGAAVFGPMLAVAVPMYVDAPRPPPASYYICA